MDFRVRFWWLRVFWQAVTLWLVNRGMAVRQGRPIEQVCNRKKTTWYKNHTVRFLDSQSCQNRESQPIKGVSVVSDNTACKGGGCKRWHPVAPGKRYGARRSPLSEYMSLHLSLKLTTNCGPISRIKGERYIL